MHVSVHVFACVQCMLVCSIVQQKPIIEANKLPTILPDALVPFHWPRVDLDQLLCVRLVLHLMSDHVLYTITLMFD